jgi:hypothetical protein
MNRNETQQLLTALKSLDPGGFVTVDNSTIDVWTAVLNREPVIPGGAAMMTAFDVVARPNQRFPTPGDFRVMVAEVVCGIPSVEDARRQIERSMRENYPGHPVKYTPDQLVLEAARSIGGTYMFRNAQSERETADLWRRFATVYDLMRAERLELADIAAEYTALSALQRGTLTALPEKGAA